VSQPPRAEAPYAIAAMMRLAAAVLHDGSKAVEQSHDWPAGGCYAVAGPCCFAGERYQSTAD